MTRAYRMLVTVYVEGHAAELPEAAEMAEEVATLVQNEDDHNFSVSVRAIETEDYRGHEYDIGKNTRRA